MRPASKHDGTPTPALDRRLCVAPMMDWTDRHCRYFLRLFSPRALLYTEMIVANAIARGDVERLLGYDAAEQPVALQLGGSDPKLLAAAAATGERFGYREINLNVGCPSDRVRDATFGACLMAKPRLVADCVRAMQDAVGIPVTVKTRIGIDDRDDYAFLRAFVEEVVGAGCEVLIVHARKAVLSGLSPKQNREVPPLDYPRVWQVKRDWPAATVVVNGGLKTVPQAVEQWRHVDGVMLGREAYHNPYVIADLHRAAWDDGFIAPTPEEVVERMQAYAARQAETGTPLRPIARHMLGLFAGRPGARDWRRAISEGLNRGATGPGLLAEALRAVSGGVRPPAGVRPQSRGFQEGSEPLRGSDPKVPGSDPS